VVFILATTNPEKLIETIRSRTTFIPFRKANSEEIISSLQRVVKGEKMKVDDETVGVIAEAADGSFRDGIKILEQLISEEKELTKDFLEEYLFRKKAFDINTFLSLLSVRDTKSLISEIEALSIKGVSANLFVESLLKKLKNGLLAAVGVGEDKIPGIDKKSLLTLIDLFLEASQNISNSPIEELPLEIAVIKWCGDGDSIDSQTIHSDKDPDISESATKSQSMPKVEVKETLKIIDVVVKEDSQTIVPEVHSSPSDLPIGEGVNDDVWKNILNLIKPINASIEALLRAAKPMTYDGKVLTLGVYYKFHKERLEDIRHRKILEDIVGKVLGSVTRVTCILVEPPPRKIIAEAKVETVLTEGADKDIIKAAEEIFSN
jgi:DNA polymerase-3 subunit gamma/tau